MVINTTTAEMPVSVASEATRVDYGRPASDAGVAPFRLMQCREGSVPVSTATTRQSGRPTAILAGGGWGSKKRSQPGKAHLKSRMRRD